MSLLVPERIDVYVHQDTSPETFQTTVLNLLEFLKNQGVQIMSVISDYVAKQSAFNADIASDLATIAAQITTLNATIATLQSTPPVLTPEDQALLDTAQQQGQDLQTQADTMAGKAPPPPPVPVS